MGDKKFRPLRAAVRAIDALAAAGEVTQGFADGFRAGVRDVVAEEMAPKWIRFEDLGTSDSGKTRRFAVIARHDDTLLGEIRWFGGWRKYVFAPYPNTEYEEDCLRDIAAFCERTTREHRARRA